MTLGYKLSNLRKQNNYTQEQLAALLGVSRQAISKWESGISYPETEKLIRLSELYDCSLDYLLKDDVEASQPKEPYNTSFRMPRFNLEWKSKKTINGIPLWHVCFRLGKTAKGIFALGLRAKGVVSIGVLSMGIVSLGMASLGLLSIGLFTMGIIAAGSIAAGIISFGAICFGILAIGAIAIGETADIRMALQ